MKTILQIKNRKFGEGRPLICVPVMSVTKEEIIEDVKLLVEDRVDIIEWRVDAFEGIYSLNAIRDVLSEMRKLVVDTVLIFTFL